MDATSLWALAVVGFLLGAMRKAWGWRTFVLALAFSSTTCGAAEFDQATSEVSFRLEAGRRLDQMADRIEGESKAGVELADKAEKLDHVKLKALVKSYEASDSKFTRLIPSTTKQAVFSSNQFTDVDVVRSTRSSLVETARKRSAELSNYSNYLRELSKTIKTSASSQTVALLESAYVPTDVAIVVSGGGNGPANSNGPAVPFKTTDAGAPDQSGLLRYIVGVDSATVDYPATVALLYEDPASAALSIRCTGTLIAANAVLTAAHCAAVAPAAVYLQHGGIHKVARAIVHPSFLFPQADIAILVLADKVQGVAPVALNTANAVPPATRATIVGFGYHSKKTDAGADATSIVAKAGIKYYANITTSKCDDEYVGKSLICWTYVVAPLAELVGSTCSGDSGGPLFIQSGNKWMLAGVTSGGVSCLPGDRPLDTEVYDYVAWIKSELTLAGIDIVAPAADAGALVPVVDNSARFALPAASRLFGPTETTWKRIFNVKEGFKTLSVAMNATSAGGTMRFIVQSADGGKKCDQSVDDMSAFCTFEAPPGGDWELNLSGMPGQEYQVVATTFQ